MKTSNFALLTMGRSLIRLKDRTGAYKLPTGKPFPEFGASGRRRVVLTSAVRAPAPAAQANLFEAAKAPAAAAPASAPVALAQTAPLPSGPPRASAPSYMSRATSAIAQFWTKIPKLAAGTAFKIRVPGVFQFGAQSLAHDARPRAQAELALEKVTVLRNDLSEADLVVVKLQRQKENAAGSDAAGRTGPGTAWTRATARWIKLKTPATPGEAGAAPEQPARLTELQP